MTQTVDERLLHVLACPAEDHGPVEFHADDAQPVVVCTACGRRYPVRDGIPVLLVHEAIDAS